ncbi:hypothetical protein LRAMOSA08994 [Lichtheimia ramosa]|uniref:Uncharacterized protein n=1 Tax=Lichtheimia ramosa TaxID=688394 RepID=A0A077WFR0_9FUNG|nr:hypothetical protein LRAMOSA08994 [Lichtheimia ramosa]
MTNNRTLRSSSSNPSQPTPVEPVEDQPMEEAATTPDQDQQHTSQESSQEPTSSTIPTTKQHPEVNSILVQLNQCIEQTARDLLKAQGKSKQEHEEAIRQHKQAQEARAAYQHNSSGQSKKEDQIVPSNMPVLQLKGGPLRDANKRT